MTAAQREAAIKLLAVVLSPMGLEKVNAIREADDDFKANGSRRGPGGGRGPRPDAQNSPQPPDGQNGPPPPFPGGPGSGGPGSGGPPRLSGEMFGSDLYYISFLGKPSTTSPWMLQFGGHHLALNITVAGARGILTPTLTGAQPAAFELAGRTVRPLGGESDKALALLDSLDSEQRKAAVLACSVPDLVLGPGQDARRSCPKA